MKVLVFCITAGLAARSPAPLLASLYDYGLGTGNYSSFSSLIMVAIVVLIVMGGDPWYAIVAGITFEVIPGYINIGNIYYYESMLFGLLAATFAVQVNRVPLVPRALRRVIDRWGGRAPEPPLEEGELEELVSEATAEEKQSAEADREAARGVAVGVPDKPGPLRCASCRSSSAGCGPSPTSVSTRQWGASRGWSDRTGPARRRPSTPARVCSSRPRERFSCTIAT